MTPEELGFLRKSQRRPVARRYGLQAATFDEVHRLLENFEASRSPEWQQAARECELWIAHITARGEQTRASPEITVGAIAETAAELGALATALHGNRRNAQELDERDRDLLEGIASDVAQAALYMFSRALAAWDLITADASQGRPA